MAYFGNIDEFRAALNNLVSSTGSGSRPVSNPKPSKKRRGKRKPRRNRGDNHVREALVSSDQDYQDPSHVRPSLVAHPNMSFPKTINHPTLGPIVVDDMEEFQAVLASIQGGAAPAPAGTTLPRTVGGYGYREEAPPRRQLGAPRRAPAGKRSMLEGVPEDFKYKNAYSAAAMLLGGQKNYCPGLRAQVKKGETLSNQKALRVMGLEPDLLFKFLDAVSQAHPEAFVVAYKRDGSPYNRVVRENITPDVIHGAFQIINGMGIQCPLAGRVSDVEAESNPYYW